MRAMENCWKQLNNMRLFIAILIVFDITREAKTSGVVDSDASFYSFCVHSIKGAYSKRSSDKSEIGDQCETTFPVFTKTQSDAEKFCKFTLPFPIRSAKNGPSTTCIAESLVICPPTYHQIAGKCYYLVDKHTRYNYQEAEKKCGEKNSKIATLYTGKLTRYWNDFFPSLSLAWVQATDDMAEYTVLEKGDKFAVLYGEAVLYRQRYQSLAQISGDEVALVICEKEPDASGAVSLANMKKYNQIYYGSLELGTGEQYLPTNNRYPRDWINRRLYNYGKCMGIAKAYRTPYNSPYLPGPTIKIRNLFGADLVFAQSILERTRQIAELDTRQCLPSTRSSDQLKKNFAYEHKNKTVFVSDLTIFNETLTEQCDAELNLAYTLRGDNVVGYMVPASFRSPFLCQFQASKYRIDSCPDGGSPFTRNTGETVCHKFFDGIGLTWDAAQNHCKENFGGALSGFTSKEEIEFLDKLLSDAYNQQPGNRSAYLGAQRIKNCMWAGGRNGVGYENDGPCTKDLVFEWLNDVAPNGKASVIGKFWGDTNPSYSLQAETCLTLLTGRVYWTNATDTSKTLNDLVCDKRKEFFCQKPSHRTFKVDIYS